MKKIFFTVNLILCLLVKTNGQNIENLKVGGYKYAYELKLNSPSIEYKFIIEKRTNSEIIFSGGNNYKISTEDNSISVKDINKNIWGVFDGNSFYINTLNCTGTMWFAKGEVIGKFIYFNNTPLISEKFKKEIGYGHDSYVPLFATFGGAIGGGIAGSIEASQNLSKQISVLLDIQTGKVIYLSKGLLYQMITQYPDLKKEYMADTISDSKKLAGKYIKRLSDKDIDLTLTDNDIEEQLENKLKTQIIQLKENLYKIDTNISYQAYYDTIIKLVTHPDIEDIKISSQIYSNGNLKLIGLEAKHYIKVEGDYTNYNNYVKIGTWRYFYENGQIKMLVDYDLKENKDGRLIKYDKDGNIKKQEEYKLGWKIK